MRRGHVARTKPASQLSIDDLRFLIGQQVSLDWTVPFALHELEADPLAEGNLYPGDLLNACLSLPDEYFETHPDVGERLRAITGRIGEDDWDTAFSDRFTEWR